MHTSTFCINFSIRFALVWQFQHPLRECSDTEGLYRKAQSLVGTKMVCGFVMLKCNKHIFLQGHNFGVGEQVIEQISNVSWVGKLLETVWWCSVVFSLCRMLLVDASCHKSVVSVVCLSVCLCVGHTAVRAKPTMRQTFLWSQGTMYRYHMGSGVLGGIRGYTAYINLRVFFDSVYSPQWS